MISRSLGDLWRSPLKNLWCFFAIGIGVLTVSRVALAIWQWDRIEDWSSLLVNGLRLDVALLSQITLITLVPLAILPQRCLASPAFRRLLLSWCSCWLFFLVFMEVITPPYIDFFGTRPGRIFFEYLGRPAEITGLLAGAYKVASFIGLTVPLGIVLFARRYLLFDPANLDWPMPGRLVLLVPLFLLLVLGARSTLGHRPINPSMVAVSNDQLVNDLVLSSSYKLLYAIYSLRHERNPGEVYPALPESEIISTVRASTAIDSASFVDPESTQHRFGEAASPASSNKNIVIVVEESLGARFVGKLGGLPLTPNLDRLSDKGIWLSRLYATGIRSARGLEAVVSGFPPSPARSVLKLGKAQNNFYTLASTLGQHGYKNYFIYGGEGHFDNMQGFFLNNDFDVAIDVDDYEDYTFKGTWGVSDEDLFNKADQVMSAQKDPFFALIFTSSFHSPYEFPDDRIELYEEPKRSKHNAVKYADYALGQFMNKAMESNYWEDTVFLIVADHDERPRGKSLVPIESYHIPGLILGADIAPFEYAKVCSQIDLLPTLLSLANISGTAPFVGNDLLALPDSYPGRAIMQYGDNHGYLEGQRVVIHRPNLEAAQFRYQEGKYTPVPEDPGLVKEAQAWALLPGLLYREGKYSLLNKSSAGDHPRVRQVSVHPQARFPQPLDRIPHRTGQ